MSEVRKLAVSEIVWVEETDRSCRVVLECDDRTGAGVVLELLSRVLPQAVPWSWRQRLDEATALDESEDG